MLNYLSIRDLYKSTDTIEANNLVIAEWNMNKYSTIKEFGTYVPDSPPFTYTENDTTNVATGDNYFIYDDGSTRLDPTQKYLSKLSSVFEPGRPDPGIVLLQYFSNMTFAPSTDAVKVRNINTASARYYMASDTRDYDYFNSSKKMKTDTGFVKYGVSNLDGTISMVKPFVVYDGDPIFSNKITIKVQNHLSVPENFAIDILYGTTWVESYSSTSSADFSTGVLNIYWNGSAWTKTVARVDDFDELILENPTQFKKINGIRFRVSKMTKVYANKEKTQLSPASLELIEISPRLEVDVTQYVESFSLASSIGDSTSFGLPVGTVVAGTGNISLSNEDGQFLFASILSTSKMLNEDVKFSFFQKVYVPEDDETFNIPLGVMFSNNWIIGEDYSVTVSLEDGMKYLRQTPAPDLMIPSYAAMSAIILMVLDNSGITGLEFKKSSDYVETPTTTDELSDTEDVIIKNFFCQKEQTIAEVFEQLAIATQCSMFYDAVGRLNVLTKERIAEDASIEESTGPSDEEIKTDFWLVSDENVTVSEGEYSYINDYTANVASISEEKINPVTDGDITYHYFGPRKQPLSSTLEDTKKKIFDELNQDQFPMNSLAFSNFDYNTMILWAPPDGSEAVLGAANILKDVTNRRLKDVFTGTYTQPNKEEVIRRLYKFNKDADDRQSLIIYLDTNEGYTIPDYEGYILLDNEYIKYYGKLFYVAGTNGIYGFKIVFTPEEFEQLIASLGKGDSISFRGLVIDVKLKVVGKVNNKYEYQVIGDGRGMFNSDVAKHFSVIEESDGLDKDKRFKLMLGESANYKVPGNLSATTKFNFLDKIKYKSAKKVLGTIPRESVDTYLGFLKLSGPTAPTSETNLLESIFSASASKTVSDRLKETNEQVDKDVPSDEDNPDQNFDPYVYLQGERIIYGQKITLPFEPNVISTRMRLYSPRKKIDKDIEIMSTNSSIAGIAFGINQYGEGYYLEVESAGSGKEVVEEEARKNLRFYKVQLRKDKKGKLVYWPSLLMSRQVGGFTVFDTSVQVIKSDNAVLDPVFELDIMIEKITDEDGKKKMEYTIYYGDTKIGRYIEKVNEAINVNSNNICMFVRNDSQAIYEYIMAAAKPKKKSNKSYFRGYKKFDKLLSQGIIPVNKSFLFKDDKNDALFYFNDFARLARQVKEYNIRFSTPALTSALIDVSEVNPQYLIKKYKPTAFGARLVVANTSFGAVRITSDTNLPLYIIGIGLEEISTGIVTAKDIYDQGPEDRLRKTDRQKNVSIYGEQTFSLDSQYIQSMSQARSMMYWVLDHCSRQRIKISMEVFNNPLLELGDKVKIYDKSRGYYEGNDNFGAKTFVISAISRSVGPTGPSMNITVTEVGED